MKRRLKKKQLNKMLEFYFLKALLEQELINRKEMNMLHRIVFDKSLPPFNRRYANVSN